MRSRIEPMKKITRSLRQPRELMLNYFQAQKQISSGVVEGLNNKAKVTMRKSYGFRTFRVLEMALYHSLRKLPEPECTHGIVSIPGRLPSSRVNRALQVS
jgi:transposase